MRSLAFAFALAFSCGSPSEEIEVNSCLRLYCKDRDVNSKISNTWGHGAFFPARIDPHSKGLLGPKKGWNMVEYFIDEATFNLAVSECRHDEHEFHFYATDAGKFEKAAPWVLAVKFHRYKGDADYGKSVRDVKFVNKKCAEMENYR